MGQTSSGEGQTSQPEESVGAAEAPGKAESAFPQHCKPEAKDCCDRIQVFPYMCLADLAVLCPSGVEGLGTFCTEEPYNQGRAGREGHQVVSVKYARFSAQRRAFFSWLRIPLRPGPLAELSEEMLGPEEVFIPNSVGVHQKQTNKNLVLPKRAFCGKVN